MNGQNIKIKSLGRSHGLEDYHPGVANVWSYTDFILLMFRFMYVFGGFLSTLLQVSLSRGYVLRIEVVNILTFNYTDYQFLIFYP